MLTLAPNPTTVGRSLGKLRVGLVRRAVDREVPVESAGGTLSYASDITRFSTHAMKSTKPNEFDFEVSAALISDDKGTNDEAAATTSSSTPR